MNALESRSFPEKELVGFLEQKISHFFSGGTHFFLNEILLAPQYMKQEKLWFPPPQAFKFFLL